MKETYMVMTPERPPRENLVRAAPGGYEVRAIDSEDGPPELVGHFSNFGEWYRIDSVREGTFMERTAKGAFAKTFEENRDRIRPTFQHGHDPTMGDQVLGPVKELREDDRGAFYRVPLLEGIPPLVMNGLRAGLYGSSFRFNVTRDEFVRNAPMSDYNPDALPERTILEARVHEFGPVTFPAAAGASASVRSMTDEFTFGEFTKDPARLRDIIDYTREEAAPSEPAPADATPVPERRDPPSEPEPKQEEEMSDIDRFTSIETLAARRDEVVSRQQFLDQEYAGRALPTEAQTEWDSLKEERTAIDERVKHLTERIEYLKGVVKNKPDNLEPEPPVIDRSTPVKSRIPDNIWDLSSYRQVARSREDEQNLIRDGAHKALELAKFASVEIKREDAQSRVDRLMQTVRGGDGEEGSGQAVLARMILATGSEIYRRAFGKYLAQAPMTGEEQNALAGGTERALSLTGAAGGFAVPFELDPTILMTSNGVVNPFRAISRVENITVDEWRGVSSAGVTAAYAAEATETTDNAPTLAQPTVSTEKAQAYIPFSIEVGMDWTSLQSEMARLLQDAKDTLEASKFVSGSGTNEPFGVITGATNTVNATSPQTFTLANLYALQGALPPRYEPNAKFVANNAILNLIRQFDTQGGAGLWVRLAESTRPGGDGRLGEGLLGYPTYSASTMASTPATAAKFLLFGDFSRYLIAERIGLTVELMPLVVGTNHRPTGERGLYAYWRNGAKVLDANAFRVLLGVA